MDQPSHFLFKFRSDSGEAQTHSGNKVAGILRVDEDANHTEADEDKPDGEEWMLFFKTVPGGGDAWQNAVKNPNENNVGAKEGDLGRDQVNHSLGV